MFFWNCLALSMIQWMLAIWSLVPLPFLKPAWISGSLWFTYCWSLAWRIFSITLVVGYFCMWKGPTGSCLFSIPPLFFLIFLNLEGHRWRIRKRIKFYIERSIINLVMELSFRGTQIHLPFLRNKYVYDIYFFLLTHGPC